MGELQSINNYENRGIEKLLSMSDLLIEESFGFRCLNQYLSDLEALRSGIPYSHLGISERRDRSRPMLLVGASEKDAKIVTSPWLIRSSDKTPTDSIALLRLEGVMSSTDGNSSYGVQYQADLLRTAYQNPNIAGIILEINSGGGEVIAMNILTSALRERNKPVISFAHLAASAAYGAAAATDEVIASDPMVEVGSIGAMINVNTEFLSFYKANFKSFYGKDAPNKNKHLREAIKENYDPMQEAADAATTKFHEFIKGARQLKGGESYQSHTLSGEMFAADEAKRRGLIDGIGNLSYAAKRTMSWSKKYKQNKA